MWLGQKPYRMPVVEAAWETMRKKNLNTFFLTVSLQEFFSEHSRASAQFLKCYCLNVLEIISSK